MARPQAHRNLRAFVGAGEIPSGCQHYPVLANDEGPVEHREVLDRFANLWIEDIPFSFAQALERIDRQLAALLQYVVVVAPGADCADRVPLQSLLATLQRYLDQGVNHLSIQLTSHLHAPD